jgi:esterase/lipase superfamily enzyme
MKVDKDRFNEQWEVVDEQSIRLQVPVSRQTTLAKAKKRGFGSKDKLKLKQLSVTEAKVVIVRASKVKQQLAGKAKKKDKASKVKQSIASDRIQMNVRLSKALIARLTKHAMATDRTKTAIIERALKKYLK